jgi:hypothetical protein
MELLQEKLIELQAQAPPLDSHEKLSELENYCDELGYFFSDLISQLPGANDLSNAPEGAKDSEGHRSVLDAILNHGSSIINTPESQLFRRSSIRSMGRTESVRFSGGRVGSSDITRPSTLFKRNGPITTSTWAALTNSTAKKDALKPSDEDDDSDIDIEFVPLTKPEPYKPWTHHEEAEEYVSKLGAHVLSTWGVLYCGGKTPLEKALKTASRKARIEMHSESFAW